ncbi:Short-chain dehydrogenase/reductas [Mycobacteroides abscessus]|uniref:Short-chain dehydrogenase/reductas n=7 Tax=Mycobacteroides abscessus TaxID=36809 RepID=A0A0U0ZPV9_9MYCO|nr:SDR family oxidoreductase [Mycobacteroides abscessus]ESV58449.1 short chain dehydrogenase family protein [Mycobacteroides abscessus MAB_082312_2258]ESV61835.1 short chain dehydrogenase family protein [Mycobacteroides abscessus MAB_091912_2446]AFN62539.2 short-chain dehydrogenase [Mycobacteroides abscessus subsp. massiliense str. GO 06]AGM27264.1 short chain dehydrogenase [Mycobacteroides abscessus subsp. bolletii 50594]AMU24705.1 short-chain dehydrogenase [Mycobacteroides abscessus]
MSDEVVVVIGVGGMGRVIARRQGIGKTLLLADHNQEALQAVVDELKADGHNVIGQRVDVSSRASVSGLAQAAAGLGRVAQVAHTAGLSPAQSPTAAILAVDLVGVALVVEEFGKIVTSGGAGVVIASMAGHMPYELTAEQEQELGSAHAEDLLSLPYVQDIEYPAVAYQVSKRANHIRVRFAARQWGMRGARINSISPGVVSTTMGHQELASETGAITRSMVDGSASGRIGTSDDIAAAAAFLLGPESSYVTGTDLLVDGGVIAAVRSGQLFN